MKNLKDGSLQIQLLGMAVTNIDALQCRGLTRGQPFHGDFKDEILFRKIRPVLLRGRS